MNKPKCPSIQAFESELQKEENADFAAPASATTENA